MSQRDVVQSHLEAMMIKHLEVEELHVEPDGEVPVFWRSATFRVRVKECLPRLAHIEAYSVVVDDVDADPGLFEALNTLNLGLVHLRAFWHERKVVAAGQLVGPTAEQVDLDCLLHELASFAHGEGPRLAGIFGGRVSCPDYEEDE